MNVIFVDLTPTFRDSVAKHIKYYGHKRTEAALQSQNLHPSFISALLRSIFSREGW